MTGTDLEFARGMELLESEINAAHAQAVSSANLVVTWAVKCGHLLSEAKERVPHGGWAGWLEENFDGSAWVARKYMQLARAEAANQGSITSSGSITSALKSIATPRHQIEAPKPAPDSQAGLLLASARSALRGSDEEIVEAIVVESAPTGIEERRWTAALRRHEELRKAMTEAVNPSLTPTACAQALQEASINARRFAVELEQMAEARRRGA